MNKNVLQKFDDKNIGSEFCVLASKRTSGLFSPHEKIFGEHAVQKNMSAEFAESLSSPEVSPIKGGLGITPQTEPRPKMSLQSPGFSPICANPRIIEDDQGSFIQEPLPGSKITTAYYNSFRILYYCNFKCRCDVSIINPYIVILFLFDSHSLNVKKLFTKKNSLGIITLLLRARLDKKNKKGYITAAISLYLSVLTFIESIAIKFLDCTSSNIQGCNK